MRPEAAKKKKVARNHGGAGDEAFSNFLNPTYSALHPAAINLGTGTGGSSVRCRVALRPLIAFASAGWVCEQTFVASDLAVPHT